MFCVVVLQHDMEDGYRRLAMDQPVGLRHTGYVISLEAVTRNAAGEIAEIRVTARPSSEGSKPKAFVHWVSDPLICTVRLYERLYVCYIYSNVHESLHFSTSYY